MSDQILVATRKGVFRIDRTGGSWKIGATSFLGDNCNMLLADPRDGTWYACLDHGHFGVKIHRSENRGESWEECGVPVYPGDPEPAKGPIDNSEGSKSSLKLVWSLETGGPDQVYILYRNLDMHFI